MSRQDIIKKFNFKEEPIIKRNEDYIYIEGDTEWEHLEIFIDKLGNIFGYLTNPIISYSHSNY